MKIILWGKEENREKVQLCIEEKFGKQVWKHTNYNQETNILHADIYDVFFKRIIEKYQDIELSCYDRKEDEERGSSFWISHELKTKTNEEGQHIAVYSSHHYWS